MGHLGLSKSSLEHGSQSVVCEALGNAQPFHRIPKLRAIFKTLGRPSMLVGSTWALGLTPMDP
jgi:hypothetical protein